MGDFERNKRLIKQLHKLDLMDLKNLSMLYDMCIAVKDEDIELAKSEMRVVKDNSAMLTRTIAKDSSAMLTGTTGKDAAELYWKAMLFLAQNRDLDCGLIYLERYRDHADRFYLPRRRVFLRLGITQALQRLIDDEIDILTLSCAPGIGKAQPLSSKVLTPDGFKRMGDIRVGDKVISGENRVCNVIGVYPQGVKPVYEIEFDDGSKVKSTDEHLWKVQTRDDLSLIHI